MHKLLKTMRLWQKAQVRVPGLTQLLSKRPDQFSLGVWPTYFSKAKGVEVWDLDGNCYMDMSLGGVGATILGYADDDVDNAVIDGIRTGVSSTLNCPEELELADLLCEIHPWAEKVRYTRSGGEAMAVAVRVARAFTGREKITFCGYHGWHDWYLSANLNEHDALSKHLLTGLEPLGVPGHLKDTAFPFNYNKVEELQAIVEKYGDKLAAIVLEPIRNQQPTDQFLEKVSNIARKNGSVLIVDEISSGFRLNSGGAHLKFGIEPDIAVFAKGISNGYPMAAIIGKSNVMAGFEKTFISSTSWTEKTGPTAAIATIKKHQNMNVSEHLNKIGRLVQEGWIKLADKHGLNIAVAGIYPLSHFNFEYPNVLSLKAFFIQEMLERNILASNVFYAMYAHNQQHVERYLEAVDDVFSEIKIQNQSNQIEKKLKGRPAVSGFKRLT